MAKMHSCLLGLSLLAGFVLIPIAPPPCIQEAEDRSGFIYAEGDQLMLDGEPFLMKGFNYYPRDYGWTSMADWDWEEVDRELALAALLNANTIRTGINWQYITGNTHGRWDIYSHYRIEEESLKALDQLLSLAEKHQLKVVLWLMDGLYWELWDPRSYPTVEAHLRQLIPRYAEDPRIAAWDLMTDIDAAMLQPLPLGCFGVSPACTKENMLNFLQNSSATIRELDSNHLITVGFAWPASSLLTQEFTDFLAPQFLGGDHPEVLDKDRIGDVEDYGRWDDLLVDRESALAQIEGKVCWMQSHLERPMPIVLSEYGLPTAGSYGSPEFQKAVYEGVLEVALLRLKLAGALNWALTDFVWPPKAYTVVPLDAPMSTLEEKSFGVFDLEYHPKAAAEIAKAYYAQSPTIELSPDPPSELLLVFDQSFVPDDDPRELSLVFDWIAFKSDQGSIIERLDLGTDQARSYLMQGFYADEGPWGEEAENFVWAGGVSKRAALLMPEGTAGVDLRVFSPFVASNLEIQSAGRIFNTVRLRSGWGVYQLIFLEPEHPADSPMPTVYGSMNLPFSEGEVSLQIRYEGGDWQEVGSSTPARGQFVAEIPFKHAGRVDVRAVWEGAGYYQSAESNALAFDVPPLPSSLVLEPLNQKLQEGQPLNPRGHLSPAAPGEEIRLSFKGPDGALEEAEVLIDGEGEFQHDFTPWGAGSWTVLAEWVGNSDLSPAQAMQEFEVEAVRCSLACQLSEKEIRTGDPISVTGELRPDREGAELVLLFTSPQGEPVSQPISTTIDGQFEYVFTPSQVGGWEVQAFLGVDPEAAACGCGPLAFRVTKGLNQPLRFLTGGSLLILGLVVVYVLYRNKSNRGDIEDL